MVSRGILPNQQPTPLSTAGDVPFHQNRAVVALLLRVQETKPHPGLSLPPCLPVSLPLCCILGDNVRLLAKSFNLPGDHVGQSSTGYRWPYGPVAIVSPFNFPLGERAGASEAAAKLVPWLCMPGMSGSRHITPTANQLTSVCTPGSVQ